MKIKDNQDILQRLLGINNASAMMYTWCYSMEYTLNEEQEKRLIEQLAGVCKEMLKINNNLLRITGNKPIDLDGIL